MSNLEFIQTADWEKEVFSRWREREADNPEWQIVAKEVKKWGNWEEWRRFMANQFQASERRWEIYRILDPNLLIPQFEVGPFWGWHTLNYFEDSDLPMQERTFAKLVELYDKPLAKIPKIKGMIESFPEQTEMIGIRFPDGKIVCMEGCHRSAAVCLALKNGQPIDFSQREVTLVLTEFKEEGRDILMEMLKRGSERAK